MELSRDSLLYMYWFMLLARRLDERAWQLHRQGQISYHISGIRHEAIGVGAAFAIRANHDWVAPYYRDLTLLLALGLTPEEFFLNRLGKKDDLAAGGRRLPGQWSLRRANIISHGSTPEALAPQAVGVALAMQLNNDPRMILNCLGEGAASSGGWYESVNWAAVHRLPIVFLIENNQYAVSMPQSRQMAVSQAADKALGLGVPGVHVDGTSFLAIYEAVLRAAERARQGQGPTVIEALTHRITPHSSDDDDRAYRPRAEVEEARRLDPLLAARRVLWERGLLTEDRFNRMESKAKEIVAGALETAQNAPDPLAQDANFPVFTPGDQPCQP